MPSPVVVAGSVPKEAKYGRERLTSFFNRLRVQGRHAHAWRHQPGYRLLLREANYCHRDGKNQKRTPAHAPTYFIGNGSGEILLGGFEWTAVSIHGEAQ